MGSQSHRTSLSSLSEPQVTSILMLAFRPIFLKEKISNTSIASECLRENPDSSTQANLCGPCPQPPASLVRSRSSPSHSLSDFSRKGCSEGGTGRVGRTGQAAFLQFSHPQPLPKFKPQLLLQSCSDLDQVLHLSVQRLRSPSFGFLCVLEEEHICVQPSDFISGLLALSPPHCPHRLCSSVSGVPRGGHAFQGNSGTEGVPELKQPFQRYPFFLAPAPPPSPPRPPPPLECGPHFHSWLTEGAKRKKFVLTPCTRNNLNPFQKKLSLHTFRIFFKNKVCSLPPRIFLP